MILGVFVYQSLILLAQGVGIIDRHRSVAGTSNKRRPLPQAGRQPSSKPAVLCWDRLTRLEIKADRTGGT
jgi:hypothetical protein